MMLGRYTTANLNILDHVVQAYTNLIDHLGLY